VPTPPPLQRLESAQIMAPPVRHDWDDDADDTDPTDAFDEEPAARLRRTPLTCKMGRSGIMSLSLGTNGERTIPKEVPTLRSCFSGTMSAPDAVHGTNVKWTRGDVVGFGSLGTVFQAMDQTSGKVFAVKEVQINTDDEADMKFKKELENEISIVKDLKHPRIVSYLGHDYMNGCLYIYLEYMAGGSLAQVLAQFGALDESLLVLYARELLEGLEYLHTRQPPVVHRDVKGANVLVGLDCRVKLADFGCSKRTQDTWSCTMKGSIPWMAPEVIKHTGYGRSADVWSFGCVLIEMAAGSNPWGKFDNPMAAMCKIAMSSLTPPVPEFLSTECRGFVGLCVQRDPAARPTASKLLEHELVRDLLVEAF